VSSACAVVRVLDPAGWRRAASRKSNMSRTVTPKRISATGQCPIAKSAAVAIAEITARARVSEEGVTP